MKRRIEIDSLNFRELVEARITDTNVELESHDRDVDAIDGALVAHGAAAMPTVMLSNS